MDTVTNSLQALILDALAQHGGAFYLSALAPSGGTKSARYAALRRAAERLDTDGKIVVMRNCGGATKLTIALAGVVPGSNSPFGGCTRYTDASPAELEANSEAVRADVTRPVKQTAGAA